MLNPSIHSSTDPRAEPVHRGMLVLLGALVMAALAFCTYKYWATQPTRAMLTKPDGQLEWLRQEFHLTDAQFSRIKAAHDAYAPKCASMCQQIAEANERLSKDIGVNRTVTPEVQMDLAEALRVQTECRQALLSHVYRVAAEMSPGEGARYIAMMKERLIQPAITHEAMISEQRR